MGIDKCQLSLILQEKLAKKQCKLTAGENITIDEETCTISATGGSGGDSLWDMAGGGVSVTTKNERLINSNEKRIINVANPTLNTDGANKQYVDTEVANKQCKLTAGDNITIDQDTCTISATGGSGGDSLWDDKGMGFIAPKNNKSINLNGKQLIEVALPQTDNDAANKIYVDTAVSSITKNSIGLDNVDNTSDLNKPISTATQTALDNKQCKLTAGNNITIDETTCTINAAGSDNYYGYVVFKSVDVNANSYLFDEFDNNYWHLFNVEYEAAPNKTFSGCLERPANITLDIVDTNALNDRADTSSATLTFSGNTKILQVLNWNNPPVARKILHVTIYRKILFKADVDYETKTAHNADITNINNQLLNKQCKLTAGNNITINQDTCTISSTSSNQFNQQEVDRLKALLAKSAFGINKVNENLEYEGMFSQIIVYNDLDQPDDNMVTDATGNEKNIRRRENIHYAQNIWYDEDGNVIFENYQGKLTYKNKEIATVDQIPTYTGGQGINIANNVISSNVPTWKTVGTRTNARMWTNSMTSGRRYRITVCWDNSTATVGGVEYKFTYTGSAMIIHHHQSNVGLLTLLSEVLELRATNIGVEIRVFQTGNITGLGSITKLEEYT